MYFYFILFHDDQIYSYINISGNNVLVLCGQFHGRWCPSKSMSQNSITEKSSQLDKKILSICINYAKNCTPTEINKLHTKYLTE